MLSIVGVQLEIFLRFKTENIGVFSSLIVLILLSIAETAMNWSLYKLLLPLVLFVQRQLLLLELLLQLSDILAHSFRINL